MVSDNLDESAAWVRQHLGPLTKQDRLDYRRMFREIRRTGVSWETCRTVAVLALGTMQTLDGRYKGPVV